MSEREEVQGAWRAEHETYQVHRRVGEYRATQPFARVAIFQRSLGGDHD